MKPTIVDSGATDHMVNNDIYFNNVSLLDKPKSIAVAKENESLSASKLGNINVKLMVGNNTCDAEIKDVLFVENLRHNLLSVQKLETAGLKVAFENACVLFSKNGKLLAKGKRNVNLYFIVFDLAIRIRTMKH